MSDASRVQGQSPGNLRLTLEAAKDAYHVFQLPSGKAGVYPRNVGGTSGQSIIPTSTGVFNVAKQTGIVLLAGVPAYWDYSARKLTYAPNNDKDFYAGYVVADAASADVTATIVLNELPVYEFDLALPGYWETEATNGEGVSSLLAGAVKLSFDAVAEAAQAALYRKSTRLIGANGILEADIAVFDIGDDAALDMDIGLADASHASDFESIGIFAAIHFDGASLEIKAHSDDGTTDVAPVASGVNAVDNTFFKLWIDTRVLSSIKFYVNGVRICDNTTFTWAGASAASLIRPIVHIEKTNNDTPADLRIESIKFRTSEQ